MGLSSCRHVGYQGVSAPATTVLSADVWLIRVLAYHFCNQERPCLSCSDGGLQDAQLAVQGYALHASRMLVVRLGIHLDSQAKR